MLSPKESPSPTTLNFGQLIRQVRLLLLLFVDKPNYAPLFPGASQSSKTARKYSVNGQ